VYFISLVSQNETWCEVLAPIDTIASSDSPMLIIGEAGIGKELFAKDEVRVNKLLAEAILRSTVEIITKICIRCFTAEQRSFGILFLAFLFQCVSCFVLYIAMSNLCLPYFFIRIVPLIGGNFTMRQ
jgi:hypothetical protein